MQNNTNKASNASFLRQVNATVRPIALLGGLLLLAGCGSTQTRSNDQPLLEPAPRISENTLPEGSIRIDTESARVAHLWSQAEQARLESNNDLALQRLFEALEVSPQNSLLWSRAAEIQLINEQAALAENFATKSNSFAGSNVSLLRRNWLIIEHARSLRGDLLGVRSAHKKVQEYQYR